MAACGHAQATDSGAEIGRGPRVYERRDVEGDRLHEVVRENLATFMAAIEGANGGAGLPKFVQGELYGYLDCGVLGGGFAHFYCEGCERSRLVAFTCAGRGFCPTCMGRRMNQTTINLLRHVLPSQALRQWVLTLPYELRAPVGYEPGLQRTVVRVFADSLKRWYERRLARPSEAAQGGLLTVIQRCSGDLRLNPHLHVVALDGVFVSGSDGPIFRPLSHLKTDEVADVLQIAKTRILKALERRGAVQLMPDALTVDEAWAARDPAMAHLAAAAVAGLPPAGLAERKRLPVPVIDGGRPEIVGKLVVQDHGFNLHAQTRAGGEDEEARARLLRYVLRPPLARERLEHLPDHRVRLSLKRPWSDGTFALEMDALALLSRLAASVPPPRQHVVCFAGVLAPASRLRPLVIPKPEGENTACANPPGSPPAKDTSEAKPRLRSGTRCRYIKWADLMRLTFGIQVDRCPACGGTMKLRALVRDPASIERFLRHQGLWSKPKELAPARAPPYHRSVTRLHPSPQRELFFDS